LFAAVLVLAANPDKVRELQNSFDHETHAPSKIRVLQKLSEAQFAAVAQAQKAANYGEIGLICEKYRDNVRTAYDLLLKQDPNPDKQSQGYRHLELQARRGIREIEDLLVIVPEEVRPPLQIVREDLIRIDDELIHELFPRRTKESDPSHPSPSTTNPPKGQP
jgi:hypothetical protein